MWSNFFVQQEEEGRMGVAGGGHGGGLAGMKGFRGGQRRTNKMSDTQEGKIKLVFFVAIVGVTLTVLGMGTEFWVELAQPKNYSGNQTCQMAHYGLWKGCIRTLSVADIDPERTSCGPVERPGGMMPGRTECMDAYSRHIRGDQQPSRGMWAIQLHLLQVLHLWGERSHIQEDDKQKFEPSSSHFGSFEPDHDGDGLHLHCHVAQQRRAVLSQTSILLFHPIRCSGSPVGADFPPVCTGFAVQ
ncbi:uncharacterized protein cacng6b isoform X3 [Gambusia affinis]|uniref:uncharacterized protein cacng6b isoform X3 n=1 Tax=Gambusia affinis TaxID=33528 RepID=UPI001CDCDDB5|nr:uncharacterized protein cacng6b isoform X3 [Gambusia affinis]XP_043971810.1 uncharacterized protein cacng6b isoform X3 [Gambusia affinis]